MEICRCIICGKEQEVPKNKRESEYKCWVCGNMIPSFEKKTILPKEDLPKEDLPQNKIIFYNEIDFIELDGIGNYIVYFLNDKKPMKYRGTKTLQFHGRNLYIA